MAKQTVLAILQAAKQQLQMAGQDPELAQYLMLEGNQWRFTELVQHYREALSPTQTQAFQAQLARVCAGEPAQYVLGYAPFYGREFRVTPATLIPRPETEELVEWVLQVVQQPVAKVIDVGTGSGAIAVTLKKERPMWLVTATDISDAAIAVAQKNARRLTAQLTWATGDLLAPVTGQRFDVIVSNPPYIDRAEMPEMDTSVKRYEPEQALYAADHGLAFYQRFAQVLTTYLVPIGDFFAEIGYHQGAAVKQIFKQALPDAQVTVKSDINGHDRMIHVHLASKG